MTDRDGALHRKAPISIGDSSLPDYCSLGQSQIAD
jgi:hypothetical protein